MSARPRKGREPADRAELTAFRLATGDPVEVMRAWYRTQSFPRHSHEYWTVGLVLSGTGSLWCGGVARRLLPNEVVIIPPGEVHTGGIGDGPGLLSYLATHIPHEAVVLCAQTRQAAGALSDAAPAIISDPRLSGELLRVARATEGKPGFDVGAAEDAVTRVIDRLVEWLSAQPLAEERRALRADSRFVRAAREIIETCYADHSRTSLEELARAGGVTPFHLVREFTRATGLSPHRYLVQTRIREARGLLARGMAPSLVAAATGFVDQSHLTTHFRRHVGMTPASYRRSAVGGS